MKQKKYLEKKWFMLKWLPWFVFVFLWQGDLLYAQRGSGVGAGPSFKYASGLVTKYNIYTGDTLPAFNDSLMLFNGIETFVINKSVAFGVSAWTGNAVQVTEGDKITYSLTYGGFSFGYEFFSNNYFGILVTNMIGFGQYDYNYYNEITNTSNFGSYFHVQGSIFAFEPSVMLRLNLTPYFALGMGGSYLYANQTEVEQEGEGPDSQALSSTELISLTPTHLSYKLIVILGNF